MKEEQNLPRDPESLQAENDFLKMKLMLERGAAFGNMQTEEGLPPEIENQFLQNIIEFEKQFDAHKTIKVYDKIERPGHFRPVIEIPDDEIEKAWKALDEYLHKYGIELSACSPNISKRELYRFTTEEFFDHEIDDMNLPGMVHGFIYDEFYPDHKYANTRTAVDDCILPIIEKDKFQWMLHFRKDNLRLNKHFSLSEDEFKDLVNLYKMSFQDIEAGEIKNPLCTIEEKICRVKGNYTAVAKLPNEEICLAGNWLVEFEMDEDLEYWYIVNVQIEGINF